MKILKRIREDSGASNTVSFIVIMLFVMVLLVSFIDVGIYFNVKNEMMSAAEAGARNVALYGGTEGGLRGIREGVTAAEDIVESSINSSYLNGDSAIVSQPSIACGVDGAGSAVDLAAHAGDRVWCNVKYEYVGIAGKYGVLQLGDSEVVVEGSAVSEVGSGN